MTQFILLPESKNDPRHPAEFLNVDNVLRIQIGQKNQVIIQAIVTFVNGKTAIYHGNRAEELIDVMMGKSRTIA